MTSIMNERHSFYNMKKVQCQWLILEKPNPGSFIVLGGFYKYYTSIQNISGGKNRGVVMICVQCGSQNPDHAVFFRICGRRVYEASSPSAAPLLSAFTTPALSTTPPLVSP